MWKVIEKRIVFAGNKKSIVQKWISTHKKKCCQYELMEIANGK